MQSKRLLLALTASLAVFLLWVHWISKLPFFSSWLNPPQPPPQKAPQEAQPPPPAPPQPVPGTQPSVAVVTTQPQTKVEITVRQPTTQPAEADLIIGSLEMSRSKAPHYLMQVRLTPRGAGVRQALLTDFHETPERKQCYRIIGDVEWRTGGGAEWRTDWPIPLAASEVKLLGQTIKLSQADWQLLAERPEVQDGQGVTFLAELERQGRPVLSIYKDFSLKKGSFDLHVQYRLVNQSGEKLEVSLSDAGLVALAQEGPRDDRELVWGHKSKDPQVIPKVDREGRQTIIKSPEKVKLPGSADEDGTVWVGADNKFFAAVIHPVDPRAVSLDFHIVPPEQSRLGSDPENSRFQVAWTAPKLVLEAESDKASVLEFANFIGPKSTDLFTDTAAYKRLNYVELVNYGSCGCGGLTKVLAPIMMWFLGVVHLVFRNYGIAIMVLVAIVRVLLHPLTKKSQVSMSRMAKLQPKVEELKKKYGDKKDDLNKAMAELYRKEGFSPLLGCLPMLLQMPIWVALWGGLNASIDLRHAPFFGWINDLAAPDAVYQWTTPAQGYVPWLLGGLTGPIYCLNILPILLMVAMLFQQILTPKPAAGPQAGSQKFMMYFMTIFFGLIFYGMPSGLTLYVMASTAVGVGEQYIIKKHIKERDEAEASGEVPRKKEKPWSSGRPKTNRPRRRW